MFYGVFKQAFKEVKAQSQPFFVFSQDPGAIGAVKLNN